MEICICVSRKNTKVLSPSLIASDAVAPLFLLTLDSKTLRSLVFTLSFLAFPPNSFVGFWIQSVCEGGLGHSHILFQTDSNNVWFWDADFK